TRLRQIRESGFPKAAVPSAAQLYRVAEQAGLTSVLVTPEMRQDYAAERGLPDADKLPGSELTRLSQRVVNPLGALAQQQAVRAEAERRSITLADYSDPALLGLAE